jgi:hypothetical protein
VLLLTLLLDDSNGHVYSKLWNIFHDFYINSTLLDTIRDQSAKLVRLADTMVTWANSPYGDILHMVNTESLQKLRDIWLKYVNTSDEMDSIHQQFQKATKKVVHDHYSPAHDKHEAITSLTRSFGMMATGSVRVANHHMKQFWSIGVVDSKDLPTNPICNPSSFTHPLLVINSSSITAPLH